jgi:hypothetical protein
MGDIVRLLFILTEFSKAILMLAGAYFLMRKAGRRF